MSERESGVCISWPGHAFGFIRPDAGAQLRETLFVHSNDIEAWPDEHGLPRLHRGEFVTFRRGVSPTDGRPCAVDVRRTQPLRVVMGS